MLEPDTLGSEKEIIVAQPHVYKFKIDETHHEWPQPQISGAQLRELPPGVPDSVDLFMRIHGQPGELIEKARTVDLSVPGLEKFYTQDSSSEAG